MVNLIYPLLRLERVVWKIPGSKVNFYTVVKVLFVHKMKESLGIPEKTDESLFV